MARAGYEVKEVRIVIEPELTQVFVMCEAWGDCPIGVQGWHHKTFPPSVSGLDFFTAWKVGDEDPVLWPLEAPGNGS